jgi:hypothetical protein
MTTEIDESAWVLVKYVGTERAIHYLTVIPAGVFDWTTNNLKALRLARREDGDALARIIDDAEAVEEHGWYSPSNQTPKDQP